MESGHSYLEADSMYAIIKRARKHTKIYTIREWVLIFSAARMRPSPYKVITLGHNDFYDLGEISEINDT